MPRHLDPGRPCACTSGRTFADCCRPFLKDGQEPPTAVQLMRSRFTAFALHDDAYLYKTLAPKHPDRQKTEDDARRQLRKACKSFEYQRLEILDESQPGEVTFRAKLSERGRLRSFTERSKFVHDGTGWRYESGAVTEP